MINFETGEKLLKEAGECYREMNEALERGSWNLVMRRAQEVVELSLKGVLKAMGVEYPKRHDVGDLFKQICEERGIKLEGISPDEVVRISSYLARERAPAFYMERDYTEDEADRAKQDASRIYEMARKLFENLKRSR